MGRKEIFNTRKESNINRICLERLGTPIWPPWHHVNTLYTWNCLISRRRQQTKTNFFPLWVCLHFTKYSTAQKSVTSHVSFPARRESRRALRDSRHALWESRSARIVEAAIFGINYWRHIQRETNQKFRVVLLKDWGKRALNFGLSSFQKLSLNLSLAHCLIGVSEFSDLLAIDISHCKRLVIIAKKFEGMWIDLLSKIKRRFHRCRRRSTLNLEAWKRGGKKLLPYYTLR